MGNVAERIIILIQVFKKSKYYCLDSWFSHFSKYQNYLESLVNTHCCGSCKENFTDTAAATGARIILWNHWSISLLLAWWVGKTQNSWNDLGPLSYVSFPKTMRLWKLGDCLRFHFLKNLKLVQIGLQEPILWISSKLWVQWHHSSWISVMMGVFTPWKWTIVLSQVLFLFFILEDHLLSN